jgi:ABC-type Fe3+ transport system permease subunit
MFRFRHRKKTLLLLIVVIATRRLKKQRRRLQRRWQRRLQRRRLRRLQRRSPQSTLNILLRLYHAGIIFVMFYLALGMVLAVLAVSVKRRFKRVMKDVDVEESANITASKLVSTVFNSYLSSSVSEGC